MEPMNRGADWVETEGYSGAGYLVEQHQEETGHSAYILGVDGRCRECRWMAESFYDDDRRLPTGQFVWVSYVERLADGTRNTPEHVAKLLGV